MNIQDVQQPKTARLEARATESQKALFQQAAALTGMSLTEFLINSAQEIAIRTIREHEIMKLSGSDREVFVSALLEAPTPGPRLRKAAARYRKYLST